MTVCAVDCANSVQPGDVAQPPKVNAMPPKTPLVAFWYTVLGAATLFSNLAAPTHKGSLRCLIVGSPRLNICYMQSFLQISMRSWRFPAQSQVD